MQRRSVNRLAGMIVASVVAVIVTIGGGRAQAQPAEDERPTVGDALAGVNWIATQHARTVWFFGVHMAAVAEAEAAAAAAARSPSPSGGGHPGATVGECTGFSIPDYIIQRESGGNPSAKNPRSSAYGCAQTLLEHYSQGECVGLEPTNIDGQRECVNRLSNGGTNLAPWSATR